MTIMMEFDRSFADKVAPFSKLNDQEILEVAAYYAKFYGFSNPQIVSDTEDKEKETLRSLVSSCLSELYEVADEDYSANLLDYIGTSEEELKSLGVNNPASKDTGFSCEGQL